MLVILLCFCVSTILNAGVAWINENCNNSKKYTTVLLLSVFPLTDVYVHCRHVPHMRATNDRLVFLFCIRTVIAQGPYQLSQAGVVTKFTSRTPQGTRKLAFIHHHALGHEVVITNTACSVASTRPQIQNHVHLYKLGFHELPSSTLTHLLCRFHIKPAVTGFYVSPEYFYSPALNYLQLTLGLEIDVTCHRDKPLSSNKS